jgi:hypothetical protein
MKYPRTPYLTCSPTIDESDRLTVDLENLCHRPLVATIKLDGSNVQLTRKHVAARNGATANHPSFNMLKQIHAQIRNQIPEDITIYAEWLYAKHSIHYTGALALKSLLRPFGILEREKVHDHEQAFYFWHSWSAVEVLSASLGLDTVPVIGNFSFISEGQAAAESGRIGMSVIVSGHEGFVLRDVNTMYISDFSTNIGKWVRPNHVQTTDHWSKTSIIKNEVSPTGI